MASPPSQNPSGREITLVAALVALVTAAMMWPLLGVLSTHFPVSANDATVNSWVLAWDADRLAHGLIGLWSPPIFYPYANVLAYSENLVGIAVVVAPVQWLMDDPTLTYNVAFLLSFVVAGVSAYLLALEVSGSRAAALIAALGFAFTPYRWAQLTHIQVLWTAWLPMVLWALHRALSTARPFYWALFVVALLLQIFSNGYTVFQVLVAVVLVVVGGALYFGIDRVTLRQMGVTMAVTGLLLLPAILTHYRIWGAHQPTPGDLVAYSADLSTYLNVYPGLPDSRWLPGRPQDEGHLFPGVAIVLLAVLAFAPMGRSRPVTRWRWVYLAVGIVAIILSLGPEPRAWGHRLPIPPVYGWLLSAVPLFDALRVPARFGMLAILAINVLAACGAARLVHLFGSIRGAATQSGRRSLGEGGKVLVAAVCLFIVWEGYGGPVFVFRPSMASADGHAAATEWLAGQPPGALLNLPMFTLGERFDMHNQYAVLQHRHPTINGVSRLTTPLMEWLSGSSSPLVVPELLPDAVPFLRGLGVRYILLCPNAFRDRGIADRLMDTLARDATVHERGRFGEAIAWEVDPPAQRPAEEPGLKALLPVTLTMSASHNADRASRAIDGNHHSRWLTGRPQDGSEWIAIDFDRPRKLARIDFVIHPRSVSHIPRLIEIVAAGPLSGSMGTVVYRGPILQEVGRGWRLSPDLPTASIALPGQLTTRVMIHQRGHGSPWFWAIDDLVLWERD